MFSKHFITNTVLFVIGSLNVTICDKLPKGGIEDYGDRTPISLKPTKFKRSALRDDAWMAEIVNLVEDIKKKIGSMDTKITNMETKISSMDISFGNMGSKIASVETEMASVKTQLGIGVVHNTSCYVLKEMNYTANGAYKIFPFNDERKPNRRSVVAFCDMETYGGGWSVFQRRGIPGNLTLNDRSDIFNKTWAGYKNGFGDPTSDYWLGLDAIHSLTKHCNHEILITATDLEGTFYQARYSSFRVASEENNYRLTVDGYMKDNSTLQDTLHHNNGARFSTVDSDNDGYSGHCSTDYKGNGFWFSSCGGVSLNGMFPSEVHPNTMSKDNREGISWLVNYTYWLNLNRTEIKIRPNC